MDRTIRSFLKSAKSSFCKPLPLLLLVGDVGLPSIFESFDIIIKSLQIDLLGEKPLL
jgi:hypothetical protein